MDIVKIFSPYNVILSESESSDTMDAKFIICDFDPNKNDVSLNRSTIEEWMNTLEIKPLVGKVVTHRNGKKDFTGHNLRVVETVDDDGKKQKSLEFDTSAFGGFYSVAIETIDDKEYIVANAKVWKRFTQAYDVFKNRAESENGIKTSWEIQVLESHVEEIEGKEIKVIDKGIFIGHAVLGENVEPAYDSSGLLSVATKNGQSELEEALIQDLYLISSEKEDKPVNKQIKTSALTTRDLHQKVYEALNPKGWNSNPYYSVWEIYPEEHKVLAYDIDRDSEDKYLVFTYSVEDEVISIGEPTEAKLSNLIAEKTHVNINVDLNETAKLLSNKETEIKELSFQKEKIEKELSEKIEALVSASDKIEQLEASVAELTPYKEKVEAAEQEEQAKQLAEKKEQLKEIATKGGYITKEELETSEDIKNMIENLDEKGIKATIADRFMKRLDEQPSDSVEVSSTKDDKHEKRVINEDGNLLDHKTIMSSFLKK